MNDRTLSKGTTPKQALDYVCSVVKEAGYCLRPGAYIHYESGTADAWSIETCGPDTYGHPCFSVQARKQLDGSWRVYFIGDAKTVPMGYDKNSSITIGELVTYVKALVDGDGTDSPEYSRALVEFVVDALHWSMDRKEEVADILGIAREVARG